MSVDCFFWFRRDLRLEDNAGLFMALKNHRAVQPIFIFDTHILDQLPNTKDRRVAFIHAQLEKLNDELESLGSSLWVFHGDPSSIWKKLCEDHQPQSVIANEDYEPYATKRDQKIQKLLTEQQIAWHTFKDQVIFAKDEVVKDDGDPYVVYTPYSKKWKQQFTESMAEPYPVMDHADHFHQGDKWEVPGLEEIGFETHKKDWPAPALKEETLTDYAELRDIPHKDATSRVSVHLRFGTMSIRALVRMARQYSEKYLNELIWRDFYQQILWHFPRVRTESFRKEYDNISWRNNESEFKAWCEGKTGYPLVDAGMRELNESGFMHNRVRMVVASFLCKHLLIDWRWGEAYFAEKLLDYDLASNNGGWQWAAGSGVDAAPYFRVFNPHLQLEKFDLDLRYVKRWVEEYDTDAYPAPMVEHKMARERALATYQSTLKA